MAGNSIKRVRGERRIKKLLKEQYDGDVLERLVSNLYPVLESVGDDGLAEVVGLSSQVAKYSGKAAIRLLELAPDLVEQFLTHGDKEVVMAVYGLCRQVARDTSFVAARLLEESPGYIEQLLTYGDKELVKKVYGLARQVATSSGGTAVRLLEMSPELIGSVGYDG